MKRKALFPGSFDPFTAGHLNILKRALTMFDEVVVAVGVNIDKRGFFPNEKRIEIIRQATSSLKGVSIIQYDNLTIDTCRALGIHHIVRGVRNMIDFENVDCFEKMKSMENNSIDLIMTDPPYFRI